MRWSTQSLFVALLCAALLSLPVLADDLVLASLPAGECTLSVETRTQEPHLLRVRARHPLYGTCQVDRAVLATALVQVLASEAAGQPSTRWSSISLGRLIDYPWLSTYLARAAAGDPGWNARAGKPVRGGINAYVADLLSRPALTDQLQHALATGGYRISGASVEKVLVATADKIPGLGDDPLKGRLPFDAMLWLLLERP